MTGYTNYTADNGLNWVAGVTAQPVLPSVFLALFTAVGTDVGTGFTEVSGGSYARQQIAGPLTANGAFTTASSTITLASTAPAWLAALGVAGSGVNVFDATNSLQIGTVLSVSGTTVTLTGTAANNSSGASDVLNFSAFPRATGTSPSSVQNGAQVNFPTSSGSWGTVISFGLYDSLTSGGSNNLLLWDYLGNFPWIPATVSLASPGVFTAIGTSFSNGSNFVFSTEYGGTAPTFSAGNYNGVLTVAGLSGNTFNVTGVNTSSAGNGMVRGVTQQVINSGVTASFASSTITLVSA